MSLCAFLSIGLTSLGLSTIIQVKCVYELSKLGSLHLRLKIHLENTFKNFSFGIWFIATATPPILSPLEEQKNSIDVEKWLQCRRIGFLFFFPDFIVIQVQFSAFSPHPSLTPSPPHLPPVSTPLPYPPLLSMCPV